MARDESATAAGDGAPTNGGARAGTLGPVYRALESVVGAWMTLVRAFSWLLARAVVTVLFAAAFVPYSLVMRLVGFDPLDRDVGPDTESYWTDAEATNTTLEEFRRLY